MLKYLMAEVQVTGSAQGQGVEVETRVVLPLSRLIHFRPHLVKRARMMVIPGREFPEREKTIDVSRAIKWKPFGEKSFSVGR
jgi:hypothetical protein